MLKALFSFVDAHSYFSDRLYHAFISRSLTPLNVFLSLAVTLWNIGDWSGGINRSILRSNAWHQRRNEYLSQSTAKKIRQESRIIYGLRLSLYYNSINISTSQCPYYLITCKCQLNYFHPNIFVRYFINCPVIVLIIYAKDVLKICTTFNIDICLSPDQGRKDLEYCCTCCSCDRRKKGRKGRRKLEVREDVWYNDTSHL